MTTQSVTQNGPQQNIASRAFAFEPEYKLPVDWIRLRWAVIAVISLIAAIAIGVATGWLADFYEWLWMNTTGRTWTSIMREQWWIYFIPSAIVAWLVALVLPRRYWGRLVVMTITYFVGFLGGHVLW